MRTTCTPSARSSRRTPRSASSGSAAASFSPNWIASSAAGSVRRSGGSWPPTSATMARASGSIARWRPRALRDALERRDRRGARRRRRRPACTSRASRSNVAASRRVQPSASSAAARVALGDLSCRRRARRSARRAARRSSLALPAGSARSAAARPGAPRASGALATPSSGLPSATMQRRVRAAKDQRRARRCVDRLHERRAACRERVRPAGRAARRQLLAVRASSAGTLASASSRTRDRARLVQLHQRRQRFVAELTRRGPCASAARHRPAGT